VNKYLSSKAASITPYTAGEQPKIMNLIKLNTNECPYPPSPAVVEAIRAHADERLRLYPKTDGGLFRAAAAAYEHTDIENIFCANGSDELLGFAYPAFFEPGKKVKMPEISYSFYPVWAELYDITCQRVPLSADFSIDPVSLFASEGGVIFPNPNAPTGLAMGLDAVEDIIKNNADQVVIVDEAYSAFGTQSAVPLVSRYENLLVVKTLSKSHALAGLRCAYAAGSPLLVNGLERIRDSFNSYPLDCLAQAGAAAALEDTAYYDDIAKKIVATRERLKKELSKLGFNVPDSLSNFLFISHPKIDAKLLMQALREKSILVRHFDKPLIGNRLRVTIGTDAQMDTFLREATAIIQNYQAK
jgi:histidinol-phosphate aminotransferase